MPALDSNSTRLLSPFYHPKRVLGGVANRPRTRVIGGCGCICGAGGLGPGLPDEFRHVNGLNAVYRIGGPRVKTSGADTLKPVSKKVASISTVLCYATCLGLS
jgi:hypothetical protein